MRRYALLLCVIFCLAGPAFADQVTVHGFVTAVHSPDSFEIADYKVICKPSLEFKVQRDPYSPSAPATFNHQDIRVGTELEVKGDYKKSSRELKADSVKVFFFDTVDVDRIALMENPVHLEKTTSGAWRGEFIIDGQRVVVSEATTVGITQSLSDLDAERPQKANASNVSSKTPLKGPVPLDSPDSLHPESFVHYQGTVSPADGSIAATKVEFENGGVERGIIQVMKRTAFQVLKQPDYAAGKSGQLEVRGATGGKVVGGISKLYQLPPDRDAQDYISRLGSSLIPEHQRNLPDGDPFKIPFRFFLVSDKKPDANGYPSGAVVVNSGLFASVTNEAELAFILSHEIAQVAEEASWRDYDHHEMALQEASALVLLGVPGALAFRATANSILSDEYGRSVENQVDRVALQWSLAAGYDIREAPQAWRALAGKIGPPPTNGFRAMGADVKGPSSAHFYATYELRRSYLESYIANNYSSLDYSVLRKDSDDFRRIEQQLARKRH